MEIRQKLCPESKYKIKCPYKMTPVGVCIHNTANDAPAANEIAYMTGNDEKVSFHYAVDDREAVQGLPLDRNAWHAGDGTNGAGNRKYISIEICYSKSGGKRFEAAMKNAAALTAELLQEYGWGIENVKKHQDFNGKYCPHRILSDYGWDHFLNLVKAEIAAGENSGAAKSPAFCDTVGHWAENEITRLAEMGIVSGDGDGRFFPDDAATRAEVAAMVRRAVRYITGK